MIYFYIFLTRPFYYREGLFDYRNISKDIPHMDLTQLKICSVLFLIFVLILFIPNDFVQLAYLNIYMTLCMMYMHYKGVLYCQVQLYRAKIQFKFVCAVVKLYVNLYVFLIKFRALEIKYRAWDVYYFLKESFKVWWNS